MHTLCLLDSSLRSLLILFIFPWIICRMNHITCPIEFCRVWILLIKPPWCRLACRLVPWNPVNKLRVKPIGLDRLRFNLVSAQAFPGWFGSCWWLWPPWGGHVIDCSIWAKASWVKRVTPGKGRGGDGIMNWGLGVREDMLELSSSERLGCEWQAQHHGKRGLGQKQRQSRAVGIWVVSQPL